MMSCTRLYVEPTEALKFQARKKRLAHDENLLTRQLHGAIALREHRPLKNEKWFQQLPEFSKQVA